MVPFFASGTAGAGMGETDKSATDKRETERVQVEVFFDCSSPWTYLAFARVLRSDVLAAHAHFVEARLLNLAEC